MAGTQPQLERGPHVQVYACPRVPCTTCGGSGSIVLRVSARPSADCQRSEPVWPAPRHEHTPGPLGYWCGEQSFDQQGRMVRKTLWFQPAEDAP
jgi:hypothetical protein